MFLTPEFVRFFWGRYVEIINVSLRSVAADCSFCRYIANTLLMFYSEFCWLTTLCVGAVRQCPVSGQRGTFYEKEKARLSIETCFVVVTPTGFKPVTF